MDEEGEGRGKLKYLSLTVHLPPRKKKTLVESRISSPDLRFFGDFSIEVVQLWSCKFTTGSTKAGKHPAWLWLSLTFGY